MPEPTSNIKQRMPFCNVQPLRQFKRAEQRVTNTFENAIS